MFTRKWKVPKLKLLIRKFPLAEQKVILQLYSKSVITTIQCFPVAKEVLRSHTDLPNINFVRAYFTENNILIFDTSMTTRDYDYEPYFPALKQILGNNIAIDQIDEEI